MLFRWSVAALLEVDTNQWMNDTVDKTYEVRAKDPGHAQNTARAMAEKERGVCNVKVLTAHALEYELYAIWTAVHDIERENENI